MKKFYLFIFQPLRLDSFVLQFMEQNQQKHHDVLFRHTKTIAPFGFRKQTNLFLFYIFILSPTLIFGYGLVNFLLPLRYTSKTSHTYTKYSKGRENKYRSTQNCFFPSIR